VDVKRPRGPQQLGRESTFPGDPTADETGAQSADLIRESLRQNIASALIVDPGFEGKKICGSPPGSGDVYTVPKLDSRRAVSVHVHARGGGRMQIVSNVSIASHTRHRDCDVGLL